MAKTPQTKLLSEQELSDFFDEITKPCVPDEDQRKMLHAAFIHTVQSQKLAHADMVIGPNISTASDLGDRKMAELVNAMKDEQRQRNKV